MSLQPSSHMLMTVVRACVCSRYLMDASDSEHLLCRDVAAAGASLFVNSAAADAKAAKEDEAASTDLIEGLVR